MFLFKIFNFLKLSLPFPSLIIHKMSFFVFSGMFCQPITHCYFVEEKSAADSVEVSICFFREFALQLTQYSIPIQKWRFFMYQVDFNHPIHVYFIGIGGISMSGLAEILLSEGFTVSGSDWNRSALTEHLEKSGAHVNYGKPQKAENITDDIDLVVYTAAVHADNQEFSRAKELQLPMLSRAEFLGQLMKTTTRRSLSAAPMAKRPPLP